MNNRIYFLIAFIIFFFTAFTIREQLKNLSGNFKWPVIVDIASKPGLKRIEKYPQTANYMLQYVGKNTDTIYLDTSFYYKHNRKYRATNYGSQDSLNILVDTGKIISEYTRSEDKDVIAFDFSDYEAYRVVIFNPQKDSVYIGLGMHLPIKMEALNKKNQWKVIEYPFMYFCGTGLAKVWLPGNEILITSAPKYTGEFKTKLRLRYKNCLSNEFEGSIDPKQFKVDPDRRPW